MRAGALVPAVAVLALACAGAAGAAPWSEPMLIAVATRPVQPVGVRIAGQEAVTAWQDYRVVGQGRSTDTTDFGVWAAAGAVGARPGPAQRLDRGVASDPQPALAASASGYAALAWTRDYQVRIAVRGPGGAFGAPIAIPSADVVSPVAVGIDDAGTATVLWSELVDGGPGPVRATTVAPGGAPAPPQTLGSGSSGGAVALAVDARGGAVAAWGTFPSAVQAALRPATGAFGAPTTFGDPPNGAYHAGVAIDPDTGATLALLRHSYAPLTGGGVGLVHGTPDAGWGAPQWLDAGADVRQLTLAADSRGTRAAVWDTQPAYYPDRPGVARVALAGPGLPFALAGEEVEARPGPLSGAAAPDVATDAVLTGDGETLVLWSSADTGVTVHPFGATGRHGPTEPLVDDACSTGGAELAAGAGAQAAALFAQRRGVWIAYRAAGPPARPRPPRICALAWASHQSVFDRPVARAGRVDLYMRLSKPVARVTVEVRGGATVTHRRLGPRPAGYARVRLHGRGGVPRLSAGRYRVTVHAVDAAGRRAAARVVTLRVTRAPGSRRVLP